MDVYRPYLYNNAKQMPCLHLPVERGVNKSIAVVGFFYTEVEKCANFQPFSTGICHKRVMSQSKQSLPGSRELFVRQYASGAQCRELL